MLTTPIPSLVTKMALPSIAGMLVTSIYNLADTFFVSQLGTYATGAVGVNMSIDNIIMMAGSLLATGAASYTARLLGAKRDGKATQVLSSSYFGAFLMGFLVLVFCLFYTVLPIRRLRFAQNVPGAVLAALGWMVYSVLFSYYVENFSNYANIYGSLTAVVITMLWMYFCMNLIFYGGLFNYILAEVPHPLKQLKNYYRSQ